MLTFNLFMVFTENMSILHLMRTSAYQHDDLAQCLQVFNDQSDAIVLIDDGCYNLTHSLLATINHKTLFVINEHCAARAINVSSAQAAISLAQLTELFFSYDSVITWQ